MYPSGIQQMFPADKLLAELKVDSYLGLPLWDSAGQPTGLIAVLFQLGRNRSTVAAAAMEYSVVLVLMNLAILIFLPSKG